MTRVILECNAGRNRNLNRFLTPLEISHDGWLNLVEDFSRLFRRTADIPTTLTQEATCRGHRWAKGIGPSRAMFA
jgi:hypothetical protein